MRSNANTDDEIEQTAGEWMVRRGAVLTQIRAGAGLDRAGELFDQHRPAEHRADYSQYDRDYETRSISTSNQSLKPQFADNFDVSLEYYFEPVGLLSAGVFLKEIKQFIFTRGGQTVGAGADNGFDGEYEGFALTSQDNGGFAKVKGFELAYQQQFSFLPGGWKGFGIYANYSRLQTEGDYGTGSVSSTDEVAGFTPESANFGISYIRHPVSIRVQFNHVGKYLNTFNVNQARRLYRQARSVVDLKTVYNISKQMDAYHDITNLLNEADRVQVWYKDRPNFTQKHSPMFYLGINARL